jgi:prolyl oligopeptidase
MLLVSGCQSDGGHGADADFVRDKVALVPLDYPETATVDVVDDYHGVAVPDPYRWLEDPDSEATRAWIAQENELTFDFLRSIPTRERFRKRLSELWNYERYSKPLLEGGRFFYFKNDGLQPQAVLYVQDEPASEPRVLLDPNAFSSDGTVALGDVVASRDGRYLAWSTSVSGSDWRTWYVRDIATGEDLDDRVEWSKFSTVAWDAQGAGFYYSRYDPPPPGEELEEQNFFQKLYYHRRGTDQREDRLVYERPDRKEWGFDAQVSDDGRYLAIEVWTGSSRNNGLFYLDLATPGDSVHELLDAFDASYAFVGNAGPRFFVHTNRDAPRGRIVAIDLDTPRPDSWTTLVAEVADPIEEVHYLNGGFLVVYLRDVKHAVEVFDATGAPIGAVALPGLGSVSGFHGRGDAAETYYTFTSYLHPNEIYRLDLTTRNSTLFRAPTIDFPFADFRVEQAFYHGRDGARIPMFLVHRRELELNENNPVLLYGYGGFNVTLSPRFSPSILPWLEIGGVYAVANIRGGGEYGEQWHRAGMLANKQTVFDDFIAGAEFLIEAGYTRPDKLAIYGGSNGGLLVGAVVNQRPELFGAAMPAVGVMDMLRFQLWTIGWAWVSEYGSSDDPDLFPVLYAYSPYHNIRDGERYPAVLVTTSDHDDRVVPAHSFKYAARLQAAQAGNLPVLIRIQTKAGHGAGKPTQMIIEEYADRYAFLHRVLRL